jgi:hypothetical protein
MGLKPLHHIPSHISPDKEGWPAHLLSSSKDDVVKTDDDFTIFPWGRPVYALQATLAKAPSYIRDAFFAIETSHALRRLEGWYFTLSKPATNALELSTIEGLIPAKIRDPIIDILKQLNASTTSHPTFFKE